MEEGQREQELLELFGLGTTYISFLRNVVVASQQIGLETLGWLVCYLNAVLQNRHWEGFAGHGSEPKTIVRMSFLGYLIFLNFLEGRHPADSQMAVLQTDPVSIFAPIRNELPCEFALSLTEREHFEPGIHLFLFGEGEEVTDGICSWTQHKNDGSGRRGVSE